MTKYSGEKIANADIEAQMKGRYDNMKRWSIKIHYQYLIFVCLFYFFLIKDWLEQNISFVNYSDEVIALLAFPIFFFELKKNQFKLKIKRGGYGRCIVIFMIVGLLGNIVYRYQDLLKAVLPDMFLCMKFWLALYVGRHIWTKISLEKYAEKIYRHIKLAVLIYCTGYLLDQWLHIFRASIRYGMRSTQLIYGHPTSFAACCAFLIVLLLTLTDYISGWKKWLSILLFLMCTTLRSKACGTAIAIILICYFVFYRRKRIRVRTILMFIPLIVAVGWRQIAYYFLNSAQEDVARYQLLVKSIEIAKDHFPLGVGFGTFASYYSGVVYSPLYSAYGIATVYGLTMDNTSFISDSFWPMVIGQAGFLGATFFALAIIRLFREIQKVKSNSLALYAAALSGLSYLLIASTAESAFVHPVAVPIAISMGFILNENDKKDKFNPSI